MEFKPINLAKDGELALQFREDSYVCSFGSADAFRSYGPGRYLDWLKEKLEKCPEFAVHIWSAERIIGQIELGNTGGDTPIGYINLYYLIPKARGSGVAWALDDYAVKTLKNYGFTRARLSVSPTNLRAVAYYEKMNWVDKGVRPDSPDLRWMEKLL